MKTYKKKKEKTQDPRPPQKKILSQIRKKQVEKPL